MDQIHHFSIIYANKEKAGISLWYLIESGDVHENEAVEGEVLLRASRAQPHGTRTLEEIGRSRDEENGQSPLQISKHTVLA